jgi:hypothetical protein
LFVEVMRLRTPRAMRPQHLRFEFPHLPRDFCDHSIDCGIHVVALVVGFDGDVVGAVEHDFGEMPVLRHVEDDVNLDDSGVIEVDMLDLILGILTDCIGDADMAPGNPDWHVYVCSLHGVFCVSPLFVWGNFYIEKFSPR